MSRLLCAEVAWTHCCVLQVVHVAVVNPASPHTLAPVAECSDARGTSPATGVFAIPPTKVLESLTFIQRRQPQG